MRKLILILITSFLSAWLINAAEPVVETPPLPPDSELELYEDSEGLFTKLIMDYYNTAMELKNQLVFLGYEPVIKFSAPTFDQLEDLDIKYIKRYHFISKKLEEQIISLPEHPASYYRKLLADTVKYYIDTCWQIKHNCIEEQARLINESERLCNKRLKRLEEEYNAPEEEKITVMSVVVSENMFISNGDNVVENDPWLSLRLNVNAYKLLGFWPGLDFWYEYSAPKITTLSYFPGTRDNISEKWESHINSMGLSSTIKPIFGSGDYHDGFRVGLGYFWGKGNIYNRDLGSFDWKGLKFDFGYFAGQPAGRVPLEFTLGFSLYHSFEDDLVFSTGHENLGIPPLNVGRTHIALNLGVKYNFWKTAY